MPTTGWRLRAYLAAACAVGLPVLLAVIVADHQRFASHLALIAVLTPLVVLGEALPVRLQRHGEEEEVTVSTTFAVALFVTAGVGPAVAAMAVASLISDVVRRRPAPRALFNVAQYTLSLASTALVLRVFHASDIGTSMQPRDIGAVLAAGAVFFVVNNSMPGIALALLQRERVVPFLLQDLGFQALTAALTLGMVPIVVGTTRLSLAFTPLVLLPLAAAYQAAATQARVAFEATHDHLTGLPNRASFGPRLEAVVAEAARQQESAAVVLVDLDRFKEVNDTLGHAAGDELLVQVGHRLREAIRPGDMVARLGGDEFALLLPGATREDVAGVATRILAALEAPMPLRDASIESDASIGVALAPEHGSSAEDLLRHADVALYQSKTAHSGYQIYDRLRDPSAYSRVDLLAEIGRALDDGQFTLHYQPKAHSSTRRIVGVEALARWDHPVHGILPPDRFIPLIEQSGLSRRFTLHVIELALQQLAEWYEAGHDLTMAVNLTVRNVHDSQFPSDVARLMEGWPGRRGSLQLEITESIIMADPVRVTSVLQGLRDLGISLSLDDFGTGYSSLSYLGRLPIDELKIDKSFVMAMTTSESDAAIVRSTVDLAHNLGLRCVAEGVEDDETWEELLGMECDVVQGFHLSRPRPAAEISSWLSRLRDGAVPPKRDLLPPRPPDAPVDPGGTVPGLC